MKHVERAFAKMTERKWDSIYFAIDAHGTIFKSTYKNDDHFEFYPHAKDVLQYLSQRNDIKLILWTCSHSEYIEKLFASLVSDHIYFDYINENPEVVNNVISCFDSKFYFDVVLDDKGGFDPETDWVKLYETLQQHPDTQG